MKSIFIFRRDLRIFDNTSLNKCFEDSDEIYLFFIFDKKQFSQEINNYFSNKSFCFMISCLEKLSKEVGNKIHYIFEEDFEKIILNIKPDAIYFNLDYTPFAKQRDLKISLMKSVVSQNIQIKCFEDYTLTTMYLRGSGNQPYQVFTPYYNKVIKEKIRIPDNTFTKAQLIRKLKIIPKIKYDLFFNPIDCFDTSFSKEYYETEKNLFVKPGRKEALKIINNKNLLENYKQLREDITKETTLLSAHIKFGTVSIREVGYAVKPYNELYRQIVWHDFYANLICNFDPKKTVNSKSNFRGKNIKYQNSKSKFKAWCTGNTGFPIVDAAMRQLVLHGWIHNRLRLIVSNFLVLILDIDWHYGEMFFAKNLIDYDPASNNGNWQWNAQVGVDRSSYYPRVFHPIKSQQKYDPNFEYCKRYLSNEEIYEAVPIVDFEKERERAVKYYDIVKHDKSNRDFF